MTTATSTPLHPRILGATTVRVLRQLRSDPRTVGMVLTIPVLLLTLLYFMFSEQPARPDGTTRFDSVGVAMLGILPFATMFLITSIAMLRERRSGTLERLLTTPISKLDLLGGYGLAFSAVAMVQAAVASGVAFWLLDMTIRGSVGWVMLFAMANAMLGVGLGLLCSAFANTEFQAVQFMPIIVIPQLFLCGLFVPRNQLPDWMDGLSRVMPLTYAVQGLQEVATHENVTGLMWRDLAIVVACTVAAIGLAAATLRRRTA